MDSSPINKLPTDTLHQIFSSLPLRQIIICRSVCKFFNNMLSSPSFMDLISARSPLRFLALRPPHHHHHHNATHRRNSLSHLSPLQSLHVYDPDQTLWLRFNLSFLPFRSLHPVAAAGGLVYFWGNSNSSATSADSSKSLVACNPMSRQFKVLPQLGSAWSRHGAVLVDSENRVMVLTELAALYLPNTNFNSWLTFSSDLPSKPRSPVLVSESVFALCDVGSPWRSQWKLFTCKLSNLNFPKNLKISYTSPSSSSSNHHNWVCLEKHEWADLFDIIKRPRLVRGKGNKLLMIGGLKSTFSLNPSCSTILILRLDLEKLEWEEAGRMPLEMYKCFQESSKLKVFGGGDRVCFSAKRVGKLALWLDHGGDTNSWRWIEGAPGGGDGLWRGFVFEARLTSMS